jgi:hypothetical protein
VERIPLQVSSHPGAPWRLCEAAKTTVFAAYASFTAYETFSCSIILRVHNNAYVLAVSAVELSCLEISYTIHVAICNQNSMREREKERERHTQRERERERETERERERESRLKGSLNILPLTYQVVS